MVTPDLPSNALTREGSDIARLLIESVQDYAIFLLDGAGRVLTWNRGAERLKGYRTEEILGQHFSRFYPDDAIAAGKPARLLALAARDGRAEDEGWRLRKDGTRFWANVIINALRDTDGTVIGFAKVTRDITERRRAELALHESEERFRLLVDSVKDYAIFMLDPAGRVATWNAGAERIKGYSAEEILGQHFSVFYPPEDVAQGKPQAELDTVERDGRAEDEGWRVRKDGSRFWADVVITAIRDPHGTLLGYGKVTRDLTERRRAADRLTQSNTELERFSYSVSHDLRAPLRAINGYAQAVLEDYGPGLDAEGRRLLGIIRDSAKLGGELIDALLNFSRLGRQAISVEAVDMTELVRGVVAELQKAATGTVVEVTIDPLPPTRGDRTLLRQVLANLIGNAFKFTRDRPHPQVEIGARREGRATVYYVKDNGVGFDMRFADKLFGVFQRLHRADEFDGTGVGLALAQRIVQRHGGRIWADGKVDGGATFFFTLPGAGPSPSA
jgi:PAS domain S-box-containing protein